MLLYFQSSHFQRCLGMASPVDTAGAEGSGEGDELIVWLNQNNLSKYEDAFKQDNFKLTEFMDYTDEDIKLSSNLSASFFPS